MAVLNITKTAQMESELGRIQGAWIEDGRFRNLLLTSWPEIESLYDDEWPTKASGSIDWENVENPLSNWRRTDGWWQVTHPMVDDGDICILCNYPFGPEGCWQLGTCRCKFHVQCLIPHMLSKRKCPICGSPFHARLYEMFGIRRLMPSSHR